MPTVDLNRLYKVRSRERAPVLKPTGVPDAAGAYLRSVRPAQEAQLSIARANAELDNDKWRRRAQGVQTAIRVAEDSFDTYRRALEIRERAEERQKAIDLKKAQNDFQIAWLGARQGILDTPYDRTAKGDDGNASPKGPGTAAKEWLEAYDRSKVPDSVREEFDEWFAFRSAEINAEADAAHEKLRQADIKATQATEMAVAEQDVGQYLDLDNLSEYGNATEKAVQIAQAQFLVAIRAKDIAGNALRDTDKDGNPILTPQEQTVYDSIARDLPDKYNLQRLEHLANVLASIDDPDDPRIAEITAHLKAWGMTAEEYAAQSDVETDFHPEAETALRDDEKRQHVRVLLADATTKNERRIERADMERTAAAQTAFNAAVGEARDALAGDDIGSVNNAWSILQAGAAQAEYHAASIRDETRRANFLAEVRKSVESARAAYGNDLLLRVGLGGLDANQQEVARANTAALYEDAPEGMRLKALDDVDLAIATRNANDFITRFRATQPSFGEQLTDAQAAEQARLLDVVREMPKRRQRDIIERALFGGGARTSGSSQPAQKWGKADVAYQLGQGALPGDVLRQVNKAVEDTVLSPADYVECMDLLRDHMTFAKATNGQSEEYTQAIFSALQTGLWLFWKSDYRDHVRFDRDGNPEWIPNEDGPGTRIPINRNPSWQDTEILQLSDETFATAFKYGMQYVIRRANGLVEGQLKAMTPESITQELQAEFDEFLEGNEVLSDDALRNRIETARMRRTPWNDGRIARARKMAIAERSYP